MWRLLVNKEFLKKKTFLYVEDDAGTSEEIAFFLNNFVGKLYIAKNGKEGLELFKKHKMDLVITDIRMSVMTGLEMIKEIKKIDEDVPIFITTAYNEPDYLLSAISLNISKYILKPVNLKELIQEIVTVLEIKQDISLTQSINNKREIVSVNQEWLDYLGYKEDEVLNHHFFEFVGDINLEFMDKNFTDLSYYGFVSNMQFKLKRKNQTLIDVILNGTAVYNEDGSFNHSNCEIKNIGTFIRSADHVSMLLQQEKYLNKLIATHALIGKYIAKATTRESFFKDVVDAFSNQSEYEYSVIGLVNNDNLISAVAQTAHNIIHFYEFQCGKPDCDITKQPHVCQAVLTNKVIILDDVARVPEFKEKSMFLSAGIHSMITLPINIKSKVGILAILTLMFKGIHIFRKEELDLLGNIIETISLGIETLDAVIEKERLLEELKILAHTDALTKCFNRNRGVELITREMYRSNRYNSSSSLIFFDIDKFKNINDTYGHNKGDEVLVCVANAIHKSIRSLDFFIRWGGEEFIIVLPETTLHNAVILAQKLCDELSELKIIDNYVVTASFGVTEYIKDETIDSFVMRADKLMYSAKQNGRNRVVFE